MRRGSPAVVMMPALAPPTPVFGRPKTGVFVKLKDSKRNCTMCPSHGVKNRRDIEKSTPRVGGPRIRLRPALSSWNGCPRVTNSVSNQRSIERCELGRLGLRTKSPRFAPPIPVVLALNEWLSGVPASSDRMPPICQSPRIQRPTPPPLR